MKPLLLLISLLFPALAFVQPDNQGYMHTSFDKDAQKLNETNAYLLGYLSYLAYPKYLYDYRKSQTANLKTTEWYEMDNDPYYFLAQFRKNTKPFFGDLPANHYAFFSANESTYDPEAILVEDSACIWLIFRGTDSVMTADKPFLKNYQEWLLTDFDLRKKHFDAFGKGKIHQGFAKSLSLIADSIAKTVIEKGGKHKKVWLCGHSLGGAQAILFAMYLHQNYGIKAQGIYAFACPAVGNQRFAKQIETIFSHNELQRFEFVDDPVSFLPPHFLGFRQAGARHYFSELNEVTHHVSERKNMQGNLYFFAFPFQIGAILLKQTLHKPQWKVPVGSLCFHHPEWYVQALYRPHVAAQLPKLQPMELPNEQSLGCDCNKVKVAKGENEAYQARK